MRKVVEIQDISAAFKMTNKTVIERLKNLETANYLQGVFDDRGKYIYLEEEEIQDCLKMINKKGKLTRMEMIEEFSRLIKLEPSEEDKVKISCFEDELKKEFDKEFNEYQEEKQTV